MPQFKKLNGSKATFAEWHEIIQSSDRVIGKKTINVNGKNLFVFSFFSGIGAEPEPYEVTVTGDAVKHKKYHKYEKHCKTKTICLKEHKRVVAAIEAGETL